MGDVTFIVFSRAGWSCGNCVRAALIAADALLYSFHNRRSGSCVYILNLMARASSKVQPVKREIVSSVDITLTLNVKLELCSAAIRNLLLRVTHL